MQLTLSSFNYQSEGDRTLSQIDTLEHNGEIWFAAPDVCSILGLDNTTKALYGLGDDEKLTLPIVRAGQNRPINFVNESGLYALIFKSRKPSAQQFRKWVTKEVIPSIRKKGYYGKINRQQLPNFIERYRDNYHKLPHDYFSVISEMYVRLYQALEKVGYAIPDKGEHDAKMMPDISVGRGFAKFLKDQNSEFYGKHKTYMHSFPDGREVEANMYQIEAIPMFIRYIHEKWIPEKAVEYFKKRDPLALEYLPKLIEGPKKEEPLSGFNENLVKAINTKKK